MRLMMGQHRGQGGPSTADLLDVTGQVPITHLLSRHRVRQMGHAARKPKTTTVKRTVRPPPPPCLPPSPSLPCPPPPYLLPPPPEQLLA